MTNLRTHDLNALVGVSAVNGHVNVLPGDFVRYVHDTDNALGVVIAIREGELRWSQPRVDVLWTYYDPHVEVEELNIEFEPFKSVLG